MFVSIHPDIVDSVIVNHDDVASDSAGDGGPMMLTGDAETAKIRGVGRSSSKRVSFDNRND